MRIRTCFFAFSAASVALVLLACDSSQDLGENSQNAAAAGASGASGAAAAGAAGASQAGGSSQGGSSQGGSSQGGSSQGGASGEAGRAGAGGSGQAGTGGSGQAGTGGSGQAGTGGSGPSGTCPVEGAGTTQTFPAAGGEVVALFATNDAIYWSANEGEVNDGKGSIHRLDRTTKLTTVVASAELSPSAEPSAFHNLDSFAVAGDKLVWRTYQGGEVWTAPLAGGAPTPLYQNPVLTMPAAGYGSNPTASLVVSSTHVYFVEAPAGFERTNRILAVPLAGGEPSVLVSYPALGLDGSGSYPLDLALDPGGDTVFFTRYTSSAPDFVGAGGICRVAGGDAEPTTIQDGIGARLAVDATRVFFATTTPAVLRRDKNGGASGQVFGPAPNDASVLSSLAQHGESIVFTSAGQAFDPSSGATASGCGWVRKAAKAGASDQTPTVIWSGKGRPAAIAADANGTYWLDTVQHTVNWAPAVP